MGKITHFATFGSENLKGFDVNPMKIALITDNEAQLRETLRNPPFNNQYCTTYPVSEIADMQKDYGMELFTLDELLSTYKINNGRLIM